MRSKARRRDGTGGMMKLWHGRVSLTRASGARGLTLAEVVRQQEPFESRRGWGSRSQSQAIVKLGMRVAEVGRLNPSLAAAPRKLQFRSLSCQAKPE